MQILRYQDLKYICVFVYIYRGGGGGQTERERGLFIYIGVPEQNAEHMQILRYEKGQFYKRHHVRYIIDGL